MDKLEFMTQEEALKLLKLPNDTPLPAIIEGIEQQVFEIKHYLLQMVVVPRLFVTRIRKLAQLHAALATFDVVTQEFPDFEYNQLSMVDALHVLGVSKSGDWADFLSRYEGQLMQAKGELSMAMNPSAVAIAILKLAKIQLAFDVVISMQFQFIPEQELVDEPKQQDQLGSVAIRKWLKAHELMQLHIEEPLSASHWEAFTQDQLADCYKEFLRTQKGIQLWK